MTQCTSDVPIQLPQDDTCYDDHDGILCLLGILTELLDDATVIDEDIRVDHHVKEKLVHWERILRYRLAPIKPMELLKRTCI